MNTSGNNEKNEWMSYLLLLLITAAFCWLFCWQYGIFGSKIDWISQHSVLPDYFRRQFYETGQFFPEFAPNIGGGQNIYNFAYYGLYSPLILISYLMPFIKMSDYMMGMQFICLAASVQLLYWWLKRQNFAKKICFASAVMFLLAGPMIFHSYNQIMFVNYMPFLCLAFMGTDKYFQSPEPKIKDSFLLIISIFLMILSSFYFSIGGMLAVVVYGIHRYLMAGEKQNKKITVHAFFNEGIRFLLLMFLAVAMSGVFLVPTALALSGREGSETAAAVSQLFSLDFRVKGFFYLPYGIGLTTLALTAVTAVAFFYKWHERVLAWSVIMILFFPVSAYLLNGGLYIRDKVFIPLLPLLCYIIAYYLDSREKLGKTPSFFACIPYLFTFVLLYFQKKETGALLEWSLLLADSLIMFFCFIVFCRKRNALILLIPSISFLIIFGNVYHRRMDRAADKDFYVRVTDEDTGKLMKTGVESEKGFYRTEQWGTKDENAANINRIWNNRQYSSSLYSSSYHSGYRSFREKIFQLEEPFRNCLMQPVSCNPVYQRFMGIKYLLSEEKAEGYHLIKKEKNCNLYENRQVSPMAYATNKWITEEEYKRLSFPYNQLALLQWAVVKKERKDNHGRKKQNGSGEKETQVSSWIKEQENVRDITDVFQSRIKETDWLTKKNSDLEISAKKNRTIKIDIKDIETKTEKRSGEKVLFLQFNIENFHPNSDVSLWLDESCNTLTAKNHFYYNDNRTFAYAVPIKNDEIKLVFGKGSYKISDIKAYCGILSYSQKAGENAVSERLYQGEMILDKKQTEGNVIAGLLDVENSGYFITTIPYEKNFIILIDGKKVKTEKVNTTFLGCKIMAGKHKVKIIYHAPGLLAGQMLSLAGIGIFILLKIFSAKYKNVI